MIHYRDQNIRELVQGTNQLEEKLNDVSVADPQKILRRTHRYLSCFFSQSLLSKVRLLHKSIRSSTWW